MRGRKDNAATGHQEGRCEPVEAQLFGGAAVSDHRAHQSPFNQSLCQAPLFAVKADAVTLSSLPRDAARRFGDKIAVHSADQALSFVQIERRVARLAVGLSHLGIAAQQRVVLHLPNTWQWIVSYFAIARLNAIVVPANILLVPKEVSAIAEDCGSVAVIAPASRIVSLRQCAADSTERIYVGVGDGSGDFLRWEDLLAASGAVDFPEAPPSSVCTISYTSGTTGIPKGVVLSHRNVLMNVAMTANMHMRTSSDTVVTALPCAHVYGNVVMNGAFFCGYKLVLFDRFETSPILEGIERHRATLFEGVPTMYLYLLGAPDADRYDLTSLTRATVGGQGMPVSQLREAQRLLGCSVLELWGMTEIAGLGATHPAYGPEKLGSIGQPLPFSRCRIVDLSDCTTSKAVGEAGELLIKGPSVMREYWQQPDATREVIDLEGWLRTGDVAYRDSDGYLYIIDRIKEVIITAGYNIYPSEIERVIAAHSAVHQVAVGSVPDTIKGELACAYVVLKAEQSVEESELLAYCRENLATYKVPKRVRFVSDLPKTSTGKISRRALRDL